MIHRWVRVMLYRGLLIFLAVTPLLILLDLHLLLLPILLILQILLVQHLRLRQLFIELLAIIVLDVKLILVLMKQIHRMVVVMLLNDINGLIDIRRIRHHVMRRVIRVYRLNMTGIVA